MFENVRAGQLFFMFIGSGAWSLIISNKGIEPFLMYLLGLPRRHDGNKATSITNEENNLWMMLESTTFWVAATTAILSPVVYGFTKSTLMGFLASTVLTPALWLLATSKVYPKINGLDFGPRFADAMRGKYVQITHRE